MPACRCSDPLCPVKHGRIVCSAPATGGTLYRSDMHDERGTMFCEPCAEDALASGLFHFGDDDYGDN